jgi:mannitol-1-/sugar-/sorbitol-6-phosphatase
MGSFIVSPVTLSCRGILFDMDGILISSLGSVERSWTRWSEMRGIDPARALSIVHGRRAIESLTALRPDLNGEEELDVLEKLELDDTADIALLPGVNELLASLPPERWTVVTSATERLARVRLAAAGLPVPHRFVSGNSVSEGKLHPAPYLAGAAVLGIPAQDCVVFEDSGSGVRAGHAAGATVIATMFAHESQNLTEADYIVQDLTAVTASPERESVQLTFTPLPRP